MMPQKEKSPIISVILAVHHAQNLQRALDSLLAQSFSNWELLAVDNTLETKTQASLQKLAAADCRVRHFPLAEKCSQGAAWNIGLDQARAEWIAYLDAEDEYYPDHLANVAKYRTEGDILFFTHDRVLSKDGRPARVTTWDPRRFQQDIFLLSISPPLAVAHRRHWVNRLGTFHELLWHEVEGEYWRRFARAGATFAHIPLKSGKKSVSADNPALARTITPAQRKLLESNAQAGKPLYGTPAPEKPIRKLAFISTHCAIDFASGAAISTVRMLKFLNHLGFDCQVFCSSRRDGHNDRPLTDLLATQGEPLCKTLDIRIGNHAGRMIFTAQGNVPVTVFETAANHGPWQSQAEIAAFLKAADHFLKTNRPEAVMTYGGDPVSQELLRVIRRHDIPIVFALRNFSYFGPELFHAVDHILVPSEFSRNYYWEKLGLVCHVVPNVIELEKICSENRNPQYLTFVNPQETKGVYVFAAIARELARRRPDIPLLVVEGRGQMGRLERNGLDLSGLLNLRTMPNTPDPREFYAVTKAMLVPSLWNESFGLAAAEALCNGIPVLASNRGALPEIVGEGGFVFDIPAKYTPNTQDIPSVEEVEPWLETIIRLWDNAGDYQDASDLALRQAQHWHPQRLGTCYGDFFGRLVRSPSSPVICR